MLSLFAAVAVFFAVHIFVSGTRVRDALTGRIGEGPYLGLFSLSSIAGLTWIGFAFAAARTSPENPVWWGAGDIGRYVQLALTLLAFLLIVPGLLTSNPTSVKQEGALEREGLVRGMLRITRHPFLWGVAVWAFGHLLVNGDLAGFLLFGTMLALALLGTRMIDAKRRRTLGEAWDAFARQTSNVPFAAILAGRQSLNLGEVGWRFIPAVAFWALIVWAHPVLFGVRALP